MNGARREGLDLPVSIVFRNEPFGEDVEGLFYCRYESCPRRSSGTCALCEQNWIDFFARGIPRLLPKLRRQGSDGGLCAFCNDALLAPAANLAIFLHLFRRCSG